MMKPDRSTTDEAWRNFIGAAAVRRGENYRTISGKSTPLSQRSDFVHGVKRRLGHNPSNDVAEEVIATQLAINCQILCDSNFGVGK